MVKACLSCLHHGLWSSAAVLLRSKPKKQGALAHNSIGMEGSSIVCCPEGWGQDSCQPGKHAKEQGNRRGYIRGRAPQPLNLLLRCALVQDNCAEGDAGPAGSPGAVSRRAV